MTSEAALLESLHDFLTLEFTRGSVWTRANAKTNLFSRRKREYPGSLVSPEQGFRELSGFCTGHTRGTSSADSEEGRRHPPPITRSDSSYGKAGSLASRARTKHHGPVNGK